jgi:hypothetical protein
MKRLKKNRAKGISKIEVHQGGSDNFLREIPLEEDPGMGLIRLGKSGKRKLSDNHDKYLVRYTRKKKRG